MFLSEENKDFDYAKAISEMPVLRRLFFYESFAEELTIMIRCVYSNPKFSLNQKALGMSWINEISHRVLPKAIGLRRLKDGQEDNWSEEDFWGIICWAVSQCPEIAHYVEHAIMYSYNRVNHSRLEDL